MSFLTVRVLLPSSPFARVLFFRKHHEAKGSNDDDTTLFVTNLPPMCSKNFLQQVFGQKVTKVDFAGIGENNSVPIALVTLADKKSLANAMRLNNATVGPISVKAESLGIQKWEMDYSKSHPSADVLEKEAVNSVNKFAKEQAQKRKAAASKSLVDEDGFTLVTRKKSKNAVITNVPVAASARLRKKRKVEVVDFYRFQQRQIRREQIASLRNKFEKDRVRISELRAQRKFKPF
eukprot:c13392_g1_i1.p1 GENE.c13392_g1_i1~~c13392_g1_i1.p1  ORF type:complete len:246 (-),score=49.83 c13392_g1_i1:108-809(-)